MSVKFLGQYLLEKGVITAEQLIEALQHQETKNLRFGDYAVYKSYLQTDNVIKLQEEQKRTDMMIGELAIKLGLMSQEQVEEILTLQRNDHVLMGEILAEKGFITKDVLHRELELFREDQKQYALEFISVPEGFMNPDTFMYLVDLTQKMLKRVAHLNSKAGKGALCSKVPKKYFTAVSIILSGAVDCDYMLAVPRKVADDIASGFMGVDASGETDDFVADSVKEFANIVCGNIMAKMAQKGKSVEISPPSKVKFEWRGHKIPSGRKAVSYPLVTTKGKLLLTLVE
jgi:CheY-specific phosphatase CheX